MRTTATPAETTTNSVVVVMVVVVVVVILYLLSTLCRVLTIIYLKKTVF